MSKSATSLLLYYSHILSVTTEYRMQSLACFMPGINVTYSDQICMCEK